MAYINTSGLEFLRVLMQSEDDRATTSEIRTETGFSRDKMRYWYDKLEEEGLIDIEYEDHVPERGGSPQKVAALTEEARQQIRKGDLGGRLLDEAGPQEESEDDSVDVTRAQLEDFKSELGTLENRVNTLMDLAKKVDGGAETPETAESDESGDVTVEDLPDEVVTADELEEAQHSIASLEETLNMMQSSMSNKAPKSVLDDVAEMDEAVGELEEKQEYVYEWMGLSELYLRATKHIFEEELDIDFREFVAAEKEDAGDNPAVQAFQNRQSGDGEPDA